MKLSLKFYKRLGENIYIELNSRGESVKNLYKY